LVQKGGGVDFLYETRIRRREFLDPSCEPRQLLEAKGSYVIGYEGLAKECTGRRFVRIESPRNAAKSLNDKPAVARRLRPSKFQ
jgi:hypothetical protein